MSSYQATPACSESTPISPIFVSKDDFTKPKNKPQIFKCHSFNSSVNTMSLAHASLEFDVRNPYWTSNHTAVPACCL